MLGLRTSLQLILLELSSVGGMLLLTRLCKNVARVLCRRRIYVKGRRQLLRLEDKGPSQVPRRLTISTRMSHAPATDQSVSKTHDKLRGAVIYEHMYAPAMNSILKPFFFVNTMFVLAVSLDTNKYTRLPLAFPFPSHRCSAAPSFGVGSSILSS
jgi:hypothetical protein